MTVTRTTDKHSECELFERLFHHSPFGMAQISKDDRWLKVNDRLAEITNYSKDEICCLGLHELTHPDDLKRSLELNLLFKKGEIPFYEAEIRIIRKDGEIIWVSFSAASTSSQDPEIDYYLAYISDINNKKLLETEMERLYELPDHLLCTLDRKSRFMSVNNAFTTVLGFSKNELLGKPVWDFIHPDDLNISVKTEQQGTMTLIRGFENRYRTKNGGYKWLRWTGIIIDGTNYGAAVDITSLKDTEQKLLRSQQQYMLLYETMQQGVVHQDKNGNIISMNPAAELILGKSPSEFIGQTSVTVQHHTIREDGSVFPGEEHPAMIALKTGEVTKGVMGIYNKNFKGYRWIDISAVPLHKQGSAEAYEVYTVFNDITERKEWEEALKQGEERFRILANNISQLAWMADPEGYIFWYNKRWYQFTGTTEEEMKERDWREFHHPDHVIRVSTKLIDAFNAGEVWEDTFPLRGADSNFRWFLSRAVPIVNKEGKIFRWLGTNTDITEIRELQQQKDEFIAIVSHELKTPLTSLKAYIQLLERSISEPSIKNYITKTNDHVNKLNSLISDLLDVTKIEAGKLQLQIVELDLNRLIDEVIENISQAYKSHKLIRKGHATRNIRADRLRMEQVLVNLLTNAIKYSPDEDEVVIEIEEEPDKVMVSVIDKGIGIPEEKQKKLFQKFYRVEGTFHKFSGLGIGLYISAEIIARHGGKIWMQSKVGHGSRFTFSLSSY